MLFRLFQETWLASLHASSYHLRFGRGKSPSRLIRYWGPSPAMLSGIMPSKPPQNCSTCTTPVAKRLSALHRSLAKQVAKWQSQHVPHSCVTGGANLRFYAWARSPKQRSPMPLHRGRSLNLPRIGAGSAFNTLHEEYGTAHCDPAFTIPNRIATRIRQHAGSDFLEGQMQGQRGALHNICLRQIQTMKCFPSPCPFFSP